MAANHMQMFSRLASPPSSFYCSLDTGRLNAETYRLFDKVEKHYNIRIEYTFPDAQVGVRESSKSK